MKTAETITIRPLGFVRSPRQDVRDDDWGDVIARIELFPEFTPESLHGLEEFSHAEVLYYFDRVAADSVVHGARHPRGNTDWPQVGIFAQRAKDRPNRIGSTIVEILARADRALIVRGLDAVDGTPVLDVKPVMVEFLPRTKVRQPAWSHELMAAYWRNEEPS